MIACPDILSSYESIHLKEMDGVKLMNRKDTKYPFHHVFLRPVLELVRPFYRVLEIEGKKLSGYKTLYYDTSDFAIYRMHHNGKLNRYKVRHRTYTESDLGFLEVKFKNNKGRTIKERIKKKDVPWSWENDSLSFIQEKTPFEPQTLLPALWVNYHRITLVSKTSKERVTIDLGLEFIKKDEVFSYKNLVIAEVKQDHKTPSEFIKVMKEFHIREGSLSKYCMGVANTSSEVKKNNFKEKLISINNILNASDTIADC